MGSEGFQKFAGSEAVAETATSTPAFRFVEEDGQPASCPPASKLGVVHIRTPLWRRNWKARCNWPSLLRTGNLGPAELVVEADGHREGEQALQDAL
ncbi:MAG: hypothetical protein ACRDJX_05470 [Solirubrobacteraceae bacterium]